MSFAYGMCSALAAHRQASQALFGNCLTHGWPREKAEESGEEQFKYHSQLLEDAAISLPR